MTFIFLILSFIGFGIHLFLTKKLRTRKYIIEILLSYLILIGWGIGGIINFVANVFFPYSTAAIFGWEGDCVFQFIAGASYLAFSTLAILCILIRMMHFWMATIIGNTIFYWGIAIVHIQHTNNFVSGTYFYHDVVYPIIIIGLYIWLILIKKRKTYMKNISRKAKEKLKKDLKIFNNDFNKIIHKKKLIKSKKQLKKIAKDILILNNDLLINKEDKIPSYIYHLLTTPLGAPFAFNKSLLDTALNFENQSPLRSDLRHLFSDFFKYETYLDNEIYNIFDSLLKRLKF